MVSNLKNNQLSSVIKILLLLLLATAIFFTISALSIEGVFAAEIGVSIGNQNVQFTKSSGQPFIDKANRTQVPLRITMEAYGCQVDWDAINRIAIVERGGSMVQVPIDKPYILVDGKKIQNDTVAQIKDGRTYLPIRAVLEAFGASVGWDSISKTVVAHDPESLKFVEESVVNLAKAIITKHVDGDTFYVRTADGVEKKLRLIGLDTPEIVHPTQPVEYFGKEASKFTETHLFVGRMVYLEKDVSEVDRYNRLLRYVWTDVSKSFDEKEIKSKKFHHINCSAGGRTLEHNRTYFRTRQEAINAGFVSCKVCNP